MSKMSIITFNIYMMLTCSETISYKSSQSTVLNPLIVIASVHFCEFMKFDPLFLLILRVNDEPVKDSTFSSEPTLDFTTDSKAVLTEVHLGDSKVASKVNTKIKNSKVLPNLFFRFAKKLSFRR